jgi:hypothetical protein
MAIHLPLNSSTRSKTPKIYASKSSPSRASTPAKYPSFSEFTCDEEEVYYDVFDPVDK